MSVSRIAQRVAIIGAGTMGAGIAQVAVAAGFDVTLLDTTDVFVARGVDRVGGGLQRLVDKGTIPAADRDAALGRLHGTTRMADLADADLVIEAVIENIDAKRDVFREVDAVTRDDAFLTSNTSSISITALAASVRRPERFAGMHFFNPVPVLRLVEVVRGHRTADATVDAVREVATRLGKTPVTVADQPGFVVNRLLLPLVNEAVFALADGVASAEDIDAAMTLGAAHPLGPLALADLIGLDVCLHVMEVLHHDLGDDKYRPAPLLRQMVAAGRLGRKSGEGFHRYMAS